MTAISKRDIGKYLIESSVIVGSILLAFAIDTAWAKYQERAQETALLTGIRNELVANEEYLDRNVNVLAAQLDNLRTLLRLTPEELETQDPQTIWSNFLSPMTRSYTATALNHGLLDAAISSGGISLISSDEILAALLEIESLEDRVSLLQEDARQLTDGTLIELSKYTEEVAPLWDGVSTTISPSTLVKIMEDRKLKTYLTAKTSRMQPYLNYEQNLLEHVKLIVDLVNHELEVDGK